MSRIASLGTAVAILLIAVVPSHPQTTLKEIEEGLPEMTGELDRVDKILSDPNRNRRVAAMQAFLKSGNPVFVSRAKEVGLFSSDAEMREAALRAVFDAGGPFRLVLELNPAQEDKDTGRQWAVRNGDLSADGATGAYSFGTLPFDKTERCWKFQHYANCALHLSGTTISLDWSSGRGGLKLGTDGAMVGSFLPTGATTATPARIPLIE